MKKIAVLTSGGDSPGMNAAIRAIVRCGISEGFEIYGVMRGYAGLVDNNFVKMDLRSVGNIIQTGGTILKTSRCPEFLTKNGFSKAIANLKKQKIDCLITIGGDGTIKGAIDLEKAGVNVICLPGTIDNDLPYTDNTIGFDTAVNTITSLINNIRDTTESHDRLSVVEVMGAFSGEIALSSGIASGADVILVPEVKFELKDVYKKIEQGQAKGKKSCIIVVNEKVSSAKALADSIRQNVKIDAREVVIGHIQRGGSPSRLDREFASQTGAEAIKLCKQGKVSCSIGIRNGKIITVKVADSLKKRDKFDREKYNLANTLSN